MTHTICRRPLTASPDLFRKIPCDIYGKQSGTETGFPPGILLNHESIIRKIRHTHITFICHRGYIDLEFKSFVK